jgi:uncharacterized protein (TIGR00288 family)
MSDSQDFTPNMAIFADFENVAIGVREAKFDDFDIGIVLERLLDKGKIVVKKAYADWDRYKSAKRAMHEAAFEMIEIPHVSYSGKNSADIRMVVDALDLCYTKQHIEVFVIVSGDSDFSPLVSKLRENNKVVIGLGVKSSTSDLLIENCDEFIYYDDLVRDRRAAHHATKVKKLREREEKKPTEANKDGQGTGDDVEARRLEALEHLLEVIEALFQDRDSNLYGSMVKQTLKRKRPSFSERFHGYRSFSELLEDAEKRGLLELARDERAGGYVITSFGPNA